MRAMFPMTRWPIGCSLFSSPFPVRRRRRRSSASQTIEPFEQRSLLSASALLVDLPSSLTSDPQGATNSDAAIHSQSGNASATLGNQGSDRPLDLGAPAFVGIETHNGQQNSAFDLGRPAVLTSLVAEHQPAVTVSVGLQSGLSLSITLSSPSVSLSKPLSTGAFLVTAWVRPQIENTFASLFGSLVGSATSVGGSNHGSLVSGTLSSRSFHLLKDAGESQKAMSSLPQWDSGAEPDQVAAKFLSSDASAHAQAAAKQGAAASTALKSVAGASASPSTTASLATAESGGNAEAAFTAPQTASRDFLLFDTGSVDFFHADPFARNATQDQLTAAFATFLSSKQAEERAGRSPAEHAAGARKAAAPESDLVLTGKQAPRDQEEILYWMRGSDAFFFGDGIRFLLMPHGRAAEGAQDAKPNATQPNVPGSDGKAAPGDAPQKQDDKSGSSSEGSDHPTAKQGSMTWAALAVAASGGFRALRNRRRKQTTST